MPGNDLTPTADADLSRLSSFSVRDAILIFGAGLLMFGVGLPHEFIGLDARYALFAKEMLRNGLSFFPTTFSIPYPDYPATTVLPIVWLSGFSGAVTPLTAVFPTAFVSSGILVITYLIGAVRSRAWALGAVCMSLLTLAFLRAARSVSPDQWTSLVTATAFYLAYSAQVLGRHKRLGFIPILLVFGFACRGPIGLIIPAGTILTLCLCNRRFKAAALWALLAALLLVIASWALVIAARYQGGPDFAQRVWDLQVSSRLTRTGRGPAYYWLTAFGTYAFSYPIAVLVTVKLWPRMAKRDDADARLLQGLAMCAGVILVGMSIPTEKKSRYVLSIVPFIALLAAYPLVLPNPQAAFNRFTRIVTRGCEVLPWIVGTACGLRALLVELGVVPGETLVMRAVMCTVLSAALAFSHSIRRTCSPVSNVWVFAVGAASLMILHMGVVEPSIWAREASLPFAKQVEESCGPTDRPIVFYRLGPDREDIVLAANMTKPLQPRFVESPTSLLRLTESMCVIAPEDDIPALSTLIPSKQAWKPGRLGGKRVGLYRIEAPIRRPAFLPRSR